MPLILEDDLNIDLLLASSQDHDQADELKRLSYSQHINVVLPVSRTIFPTAKRVGAKVVFIPSPNEQH